MNKKRPWWKLPPDLERKGNQIADTLAIIIVMLVALVLLVGICYNTGRFFLF